MSNVTHISSMQFAQSIIETATPEKLRDLCAHISVRLFALEKRTSGMKASNLNEAANFLADAVRDIQGAIDSESPACACGKCDSCVAARSDEHFDRVVDALMAHREAAGRAA